ncbi:MAG: FAD-dependent oxidoreductase [bacterium]
MKQKIAIVGSGPAGLSAAIYTSRAQLDTTIYAGLEPGGQLTKTTEIENYPGVMGQTGPELMMTMTSQAQKFGAKLIYEEVGELAKLQKDYEAVILAMGASPRLLGVGEEKYWGKGFSTCAVCDAAFYKDKKVYVVGGGDAAIEDAMALTKFASSVTILVRKSEFRASKIMQKRIMDNPAIKIMWKTNLKGIEGDKVETILVTQDHSDTVTRLPAEGLFLAIGHIPATGWLKKEGILDENGYVITQSQIPNPPAGRAGSQILKLGTYPTMTSVTGVFAAGDCVDHRYRQAATAVGMGVQAALDCERWLACLPAGRRHDE